MKLNLTQIKEFTLGAAVIEENENGISFNRFTKEQTELYKNRLEEFYMKSFAASGIRMQFSTDSENLFLKAEVAKGSSRTYFCFEVFVNGKRIDTLDNYSDVELPKNYTTLTYPLGEVSKKFTLGKGKKNVCIYFPWSASVVLKEFSLDDDSILKPLPKPAKKALCFGDSITQGYDSLYPTSKYITRFCEMLGAEEHNKAIGGEVFWPELATTKEDFVPDFITVAYGTNDWFKVTREEFEANCRGFFENLAINYPGVKTLVITPIWRKDEKEPIGFGKFEEVGQFIESVVAAYENIKVVSGYDFIEHSDAFYGDLRLHPNDEGFDQYFESLSQKASGFIKEVNQMEKSEDEMQYLPIFMSIGLSVGMALGAVFDNIGIGMCYGVALGVTLGTFVDYVNKRNKKKKK